MENRKTATWAYWVGVAMLGGCLDFELLDDMTPMDTETATDMDVTDKGGGGADGEAADESGETTDDTLTIPETDAADTSSPALSTGPCTAPGRTDADMCVVEGAASASIRFETDEPAAVSVIGGDGVVSGVLSPEWASAHLVVAAGLSFGISRTVTVSASDVNGNVTTQTIALSGIDAPAVVITEVAADPVGAEPDQEFVEVMNIGPVAVDLTGWMIDDNGDANGDLLPAGTVLDAGAVALLVASSFDPSSADDPTPSSTAVLVRLETSIGSNGLKNGAAESVELYDGAGMLVSQYNGEAGPPKEGLSAHRRIAEMPFGDPEVFNAEPSDATPGLVDTLK